jgi:hypothetical protein
MLLAAGLRVKNHTGSPIFPLLCAVAFAFLALGPKREEDRHGE